MNIFLIADFLEIESIKEFVLIFVTQKKHERKLMSRKADRQKAFELIYEMHIKNEEDIEYLPHYVERENIDTESYIYNLLENYLEHKEEIISMISKGSDKWNIDRISKVDLAIIKIASTEIMYISDIPEKVSIDEGVVLSKKYSEADAYKFVNGVLKYVMEHKTN